MATVGSSAREVVEKTLTDPGKVTEVSKEAIAAILKLALRDVSARTLEEIDGLLEKALGPNAEARRQALIADCKITVLGEGKVSLTLPEGMSRAEFLGKVQPLAKEVYGHDRDAIYPPRFDNWAADKEFTAKPSSPVAIAIDGYVEGSTRKTRDEQVVFLSSKRLQMPDLSDLAVAHAAYFLATGKDLFQGDVVRARGGPLDFYSLGLRVSFYDDDDRDDYLAASASLPPRN
jgi:hypothetical protein